MKTRHLIMLSLGGVIGTGLFFNTGYIISTTGAAGTLLAYLIGALVVWLVMQCLGELSVAMPETGAFHVYAARYLGPATGYTVAWLYWLTWTVALGSSFTAAGFCMQYWFPQVPVWIWCVVFCAVIFGLNIISTRFFAEGEVLVLAGESDHHRRVYYSRRRGHFRHHSDAGWLPRRRACAISPPKAGSHTAACRS